MAESRVIIKCKETTSVSIVELERWRLFDRVLYDELWV